MTFVEWLLRYDAWLQGGALLLSFVGIAVSVNLTIEVCHEFRMASGNGPASYLIARTHRRSQLVILALQCILATISLLVFFLPPVPMNMGPSYHYTMIVIVMRKLLRASMIVLLTVASIRQAADRALIYQVLRKEIA